MFQTFIPNTFKHKNEDIRTSTKLSRKANAYRNLSAILRRFLKASIRRTEKNYNQSSDIMDGNYENKR